MHRYLRVTGLPQADEKMKIGHKLQFDCTNGFALDGRKELTCLESGQWDASFPTCAGMFMFDINFVDLTSQNHWVSQPDLIANMNGYDISLFFP